MSRLEARESLMSIICHFSAWDLAIPLKHHSMLFLSKLGRIELILSITKREILKNKKL